MVGRVTARGGISRCRAGRRGECREAVATWLETSPHEGGGKRAGRHWRMANWADRAAEWPRPSGEGKKWLVGERKWRWVAAGPKTEAVPKVTEKFFFK
jgi:hypothetical protein